MKIIEKEILFLKQQLKLFTIQSNKIIKNYEDLIKTLSNTEIITKKVYKKCLLDKNELLEISNNICIKLNCEYKKWTTQQKQQFIYIIINVTNISKSQLARELNLHHSTIHYSYELISNLIKVDKNENEFINNIINNLK